MPDPSKNNVEISEGTVSPRTTVDEDPDSPESKVERFKNEFKPKWIRITRVLPTSIPTAVAALVGYFTLIIAIAATLGVFNAFGFLSATAGTLILTAIYHPKGKVQTRTRIQQVLYPIVALIFLGIGLRYILIGIVLDHPF